MTSAPPSTQQQILEASEHPTVTNLRNTWRKLGSTVVTATTETTQILPKKNHPSTPSTQRQLSSAELLKLDKHYMDILTVRSELRQIVSGVEGTLRGRKVEIEALKLMERSTPSLGRKRRRVVGGATSVVGGGGVGDAVDIVQSVTGCNGVDAEKEGSVLHHTALDVQVGETERIKLDEGVRTSAGVGKAAVEGAVGLVKTQQEEPVFDLT